MSRLISFTGLKKLYLLSDKHWDIAGILFGALGCFALLGQVISEFQRKAPSSLSTGFVAGFVLVYAFWLLYGLRFKRSAIIFTNAFALLLQCVLLVSLFVI